MIPRKKRAAAPVANATAQAPEPEPGDNFATFEPDRFLRVIDLTPESARAFFGAPPDCRVEDGGPVAAYKRDRYKPEARVFHVYPNEKQPAETVEPDTSRGDEPTAS
jgi:hypothetical protein